jgi:hypothetical protein
MLSVIMLSVIMLSVIRLSVILLSAIMLSVMAPSKLLLLRYVPVTDKHSSLFPDPRKSFNFLYNFDSRLLQDSLPTR